MITRSIFCTGLRKWKEFLLILNYSLQWFWITQIVELSIATRRTLYARFSGPKIKGQSPWGKHVSFPFMITMSTRAGDCAPVSRHQTWAFSVVQRKENAKVLVLRLEYSKQTLWHNPATGIVTKGTCLHSSYLLRSFFSRNPHFSQCVSCSSWCTTWEVRKG